MQQAPIACVLTGPPPACCLKLTPPPHPIHRLQLYQFTSDKKMASVLLKVDAGTPAAAGTGGDNNPEGHYLLLNKGAAEWVLAKCDSVLDCSGSGVAASGPAAAAMQGAAVVPLDDGRRAQLMDTVVAMASRGLRCICLAQRTFPLHDPDRPSDFFDASENVDQGLTVLAIVGIKDPVRPEVPGAVATCQKAGIMVRMVTGDNIHTARHIARECGILTGDGIALEGPELRSMPIQRLLPMLPKLQVRWWLARLRKAWFGFGAGLAPGPWLRWLLLAGGLCWCCR
jgi:P-type Ca2+ transporter type 2C